MIEQILVISFIVFAVWYTMQPGEIFYRLGAWLEKKLPSWLHSPVFDCPVCMAPYYGSIVYWVVWGLSYQHWIVCVIAAMGLNVILTRLFPKDD